MYTVHMPNMYMYNGKFKLKVKEKVKPRLFGI